MLLVLTLVRISLGQKEFDCSEIADKYKCGCDDEETQLDGSKDQEKNVEGMQGLDDSTSEETKDSDLLNAQSESLLDGEKLEFQHEGYTKGG